MEEANTSTIAQQITRFRAAPPCPKEEREAEQAFWWQNPTARHGDSTAAMSRASAAGQLPRTVSEGAEQISAAAAALRIEKGWFTIQHEPGSPQGTSPHRPASSSIAGIVTVNATAAAIPTLDSLQQLIARNPALFSALTELERDEQGRISSNTLERIRSALDTQAGTQQQLQQAAHASQVPFITASSSSSIYTTSTAAVYEALRNSAVSNLTSAASRNKYQGLPAGELAHRLVAHQAALAEQAATRATAAAAALNESSATHPAQAATPPHPGAASASQEVTCAGIPAAVSAAPSCPAIPEDTSTVLLGDAGDGTRDSCSQAVSSTASGTAAGSLPMPAKTVSFPASSLVCSSPGVSSVGAMMCSSPDISVNGASAVSSNLSSRRASLRMSLSVDVSQHEESSSSSCSDSDNTSSRDYHHEDGSNVPASDAAAVNMHNQLQQGPKSGHSTSSSGYSVHPKPWEVNGLTQQGSDSGDDAKDNITPNGSDYSNADGADNVITTCPQPSAKKQHQPNTPGFALKKSISIFSKSASDSEEEELHLKLARSSAHQGKAKQQQNSESESEGPKEGVVQQQPKQHQHWHWHHKLSQRPPTPGVSLGNSISIFSASGATTSSSSSTTAVQMPTSSCRKECSKHRPGADTEDEQQQVTQHDDGLEYELAAAEKAHSTKQHWHHKLSARPPTPGVPLVKPVSIFSGSGANSVAVASADDHVHGDGGLSDESCAAASHEVQFAEPGSTAINSKRVQRASKHPVQTTHPAEDDGKHGGKHCWHNKLSKRPRTPGAGLGKPVSIFSDPGGHGGSAALPVGAGGSSSRCGSKAYKAADICSLKRFGEDEKCDDSDSAEDPKDSKQRLVGFKPDSEEWLQPNHSKTELQDDVVDSGRLVHFQEELEVEPSAVSNKETQQGRCLAKKVPGKQARQQQQWQEKLSKHPPTPGVGLGEHDGRCATSCTCSTNSSRSSGARVASASGGYAGSCYIAAGASAAILKPSFAHDASSSDDKSDYESAHVRFREPKPKVVFKQELLHFNDSPVPFKQAGEKQVTTAGQQQPKQSQQQWCSQLSKRPPTPAVGLGQPVSIFKQAAGSARGEDIAEAIQDSCQSGDHSDSDCESEATGHQAVVCVAKTDRISDCSGSDFGIVDSAPLAAALAAPYAGRNSKTKQQQQQQQQNNNKKKQKEEGEEPPVICHQKGKPQHWDHKLSKRPPTPGVSLGKSISIFSSSGCNEAPGTSPEAHIANAVAPPAAAASGSRGRSAAATSTLTSHDADLASDLQEAAIAPPQQAAIEHVQHASTKDHQSGGRADDMPSGAATGKAWASKLSKRPPTPGVGLVQPVSIFSSSGESGVDEQSSSSRSTSGKLHSALSDGDSVTVRQAAACAAADTASAAAKQQACATRLAASKPGTAAAVVGVQHTVLARRTDSADDDNGNASHGSHTVIRQGTKQQRKPRARFSLNNENEAQETGPVSGDELQLQHAVYQDRLSQEQQPANLAEGGYWQQQPARPSRASFSDEPALSAALKPDSAKQQHGRPRLSFSDEPQQVTEHAAIVSLQIQQQPARRRMSFSYHHDAEKSTAAGEVAPDVDQAYTHAELVHHDVTGLDVLTAQGMWQAKLAKHPVAPDVALLKQHVSVVVDNALFDDNENEVEAAAGEQASHCEPACESPGSNAAADTGAAATIATAATIGEATTPHPLCETSSTVVAKPQGRASLQQALLRHHPDLALEKQAQQQLKMSKHPTTPGAGLNKHINMFKDASDEVGARGQRLQQALSCVAAEPVAAVAGPGGSKSAEPDASSHCDRTSIQSALLLHNSDLALEQQAQQQRKMLKHPTTPGAGLGKRASIFSDNQLPAEEKQVGPAGLPAVDSAARCSNGRASIQSALLLHNPDLALEQQAQQERKMSKHPTTPGAGLGKHFSIFKDDSDEEESEAAARNAQLVPAKPPACLSQEQQHLAISVSSPAAVQAAIVIHNPDLALEKQAQQMQKMKKHPTTPGAGLGKPFNMFKDDSNESDGDSSNGSSIVCSPGRPVPAVLPKVPIDHKRASGCSRLQGASSSSSPARSASPDMMAVSKHASSGSNTDSASLGGMIPERPHAANLSPLQRSSSAADLDPSPLRRSSSPADPDPARLSPLSRKAHDDRSNEGSQPVAQVSGVTRAPAAWSGAAIGLPKSDTYCTQSVPHDCMAQTSAAVSDYTMLGSSPLHSGSSAEAAAIIPMAIAVPAAATVSPHSPSRLSRSTSPAAGREASQSSSPSPLRRSSNSSMPPAASSRLSDANASCDGQVTDELGGATVAAAATVTVRQQASMDDKLHVHPPEFLGPLDEAGSPVALASGSGNSLLSRTRIGAITSGLSGSNGSSSSLRHASSATDPLPARGSPLRSDSSCTGTPWPGSGSRRNSSGWQEHASSRGDSS